jgi:hypothetical protein
MYLRHARTMQPWHPGSAFSVSGKLQPCQKLEHRDEYALSTDDPSFPSPGSGFSSAVIPDILVGRNICIGKGNSSA